MAIRDINRNSNIYQAASTQTQKEFKPLDFTEYNKKAKEVADAEIARRKELAGLKNTGLFGKAAGYVKTKVADLENKVAKNEIKPNTQEYYDAIQSIYSQTQELKKITDATQATITTAQKDPDKGVYYTNYGGIEDVNYGVGEVYGALNEDYQGEDYETLATGMANATKSFGEAKPFNEDESAKTVEAFWVANAQNEGVTNYTYSPDGSIIVATDQIKFAKTARDKAVNQYIIQYATELQQQWMREVSRMNKEGKPTTQTAEEYVRAQAELRIPQVKTSTEATKIDSAAKRAKDAADAAKTRKEIEINIAEVNYDVAGPSVKKAAADYTATFGNSVKLTDAELQLNEEDRKALLDERKAKFEADREEYLKKYNQEMANLGGKNNTMTPTRTIKIDTEEGEMTVTEVIYNKDSGKYYFMGAVQEPYTETDSKKYTEGAVDMSETGVTQLKWKPTFKEATEEDAINNFTKNYIDKEKAIEQVEALKNNKNTQGGGNYKGSTITPVNSMKD